MKKYFIWGFIVILLLLVNIIYISPGKIDLKSTNPKPTIASLKETKSAKDDTAGNKSNLQIEDLKTGDGDSAKKGNTVSVNYVGKLKDGTEFDSSYKRSQAFTFTLGKGEVIEGWDEGVEEMKKGGKRKITIPPDLAYGEKGAPPDIPPNATLVFEIEMLDIK